MIRTIAAVAQREIVIFLRYPGWVIGALVWPALFPLMYLFASRALAGPQGEGMQTFARVAGTANYAGFIVVGTTAWMWLNMTLWSVGTSLRNEQLRGTLESNWLSSSPRFLIMLGIAAAHAMNFVIFLLVGVLEFIFFLGVRFNPNPVTTVAAVVLTIPWVYGLSMAFAALVLIVKEASAMVYFVRGIFLVFAGISFPVAVLPGWMRQVAEWLPLTHSIEALRLALLENASMALLQENLTFLIWAGVALVMAGYLTFQRVERITHRTGSLAHH